MAEQGTNPKVGASEEAYPPIREVYPPLPTNELPPTYDETMAGGAGKNRYSLSILIWTEKIRMIKN